jgi:hypothetical protein
VNPFNDSYASADGVLFNKNQTALIRYPPGRQGNYTIPGSVTSIGDHAFDYCPSLTSVTIPNSVLSMGDWSFTSCCGLTNVSIGNSIASIGAFAFDYCRSLTTIVIPDSVTSIRDGAGWVGGAFGFCTSLTNVVLGKGLTNIGVYAFLECSGLTSVTIPASVEEIAANAFQGCTSLAGLYFQGSAPSIGNDGFLNNDNATILYLPGTAGWSATFGGRPTVLWNPKALTRDVNFGVRQNRFGFSIAGTADIPLVIEATTNFASGEWVSLQSSTLTNGSMYFTDPQWTNYPKRFYRIRSP